MTATIQTIDTPDGAFTIVADDRGRVLASGWTADAEAALIRIRPRLRPASVVEGETDAAAAALAYYAGDITAIDGVEVAQDGTAMQSAGWAALRAHRARAPARRTPSSPPRSGSRARCGPRHPSARATRRRCSCRATACCAPTARSADSRGASTSSAACSPARPRLRRASPRRREPADRSLQSSELPGIRWRAVALASSPSAHTSGGCHVPGRRRREDRLRPPCRRTPAASHRGIVAPPPLRRPPIRHTAASPERSLLQEDPLCRAPRALPGPPRPPPLHPSHQDPHKDHDHHRRNTTVPTVHPARARAAPAFAKPVLPRLILGAVSALVASLLALTIPLILEVIVAGPIASGDLAQIAWGSAVVLVLGLGEALMVWLRRWFVLGPATKVEYDLRRTFYARLQRLPVAFHDRWQSGQLLSRMMQDISLLRRWLAFGIVLLVVNVITIVVGIGAAVPLALAARHDLPR